MSFPFELDPDDDIEEIEEETDYDIPREYGIDFETGELNGKIVEGLDAIKVWIYIALRVPRYRYVAYSWDYGCELDDLIGNTSDTDYITAEVPRIIEECLMQNKYIKSVNDFDVTIIDENITCSFTVQTDFGEVRTSV